MGIVSTFLGLPPIEAKSANANVHTSAVPVNSTEEIETAVRESSGDIPDFSGTRVSTVHACARVIAEGLAHPPCYLIKNKSTGIGSSRATDHPLYYLLNESPNERQTSYEFREMLGWHLALNSNAYVFINRGRTGKGPIRELLPCDPGSVTVSVDESGIGKPLQYSLYGVPTPADMIWHLKGPSMKSWTGHSIVNQARRAIGLAEALEVFGASSFKNGAKPGALITPPAAGPQWTNDQLEQIRSGWKKNVGAGNAHKTQAINAPLQYTQLSHNAADSQWIEARKLAVAEICRFFRVSPAKVFHNDGSLSYNSVEQAHIAHDQDTDAQWHERFVQSANKALITPAERKAGLRVTIDNRASLRGTATERMTYYQMGLLNGIFTQNEAREMEGFDRSDDPEADKLRPAANLYGDPAAQPARESPAGDGEPPVE